MKDSNKTREQLTNGLSETRLKISELETQKTKNKRVKKNSKDFQLPDWVLIKTASDLGIGILTVQDTKNKSGAITFVNDAVTDILGYSREELLQMSAIDFASADSMKELARRYRRRQAGKAVEKNYQIWLMAKDGSLVTVLVEGSIVTHKRKPLTVLFIRSISARKQAEQKYLDLIDEINDGYAVLQDGLTVFANRSFATIFGYSYEELLGKPLTFFTAPDEQQAAMDKYVQVLRDQSPFTYYEGTGIKKDGSTIIVEANIQAVEYEGKPAYSAIVKDVTEKKHAEDRYIDLIEHINDGYLVFQDGEVILANRKLAEIFGYTTEEIVGQSFTKFISAENLNKVAEYYEKTMNGEGAGALNDHYEVAVMKANGTKIIVEASYKLINYNGKPAFSAILRDITERKRIEENYKKMMSHIKDGFMLIHCIKQGFSTNNSYQEIYQETR